MLKLGKCQAHGDTFVSRTAGLEGDREGEQREERGGEGKGGQCRTNRSIRNTKTRMAS